MNLFLLTAVPLAAVVLHSLLHRDRSPWASASPWLWGLFWSLLSMVAGFLLGKLRDFTGDVFLSFVGLTVTDILVVPGLVITAWLFTRERRDPWELGLWLALVLTFAGIRDFAGTSRVSDLHDLFLVPLDRVMLLTLLPGLVVRAAEAPNLAASAGRWTLAAVVLLSAPGLAAFSFAGWGWAAWLLTVGGTALGVLALKKAAPIGSGSAG